MDFYAKSLLNLISLGKMIWLGQIKGRQYDMGSTSGSWTIILPKNVVDCKWLAITFMWKLHFFSPLLTIYHVKIVKKLWQKRVVVLYFLIHG